MPQHTAKSLFDLNMQSSDELLHLYDGIPPLADRRPKPRYPHWQPPC